MRFSEVELADVGRRAEARGLAVGAWIGEAAVRASREGPGTRVVGLRELLRELISVRPDVTGEFAVVVDELVDVLVERLS